MTELNRDDLHELVRRKYGAAAEFVMNGETAGCPTGGSTSCCGGSNEKDAITRDLYGDAEAAQVPENALLASLGCGNPTALADLHSGEVVLDLGSGGGIDVLLSARRVGPGGFAYGLDMTDEMLELAERNRQLAGLENVRFLKGQIEAIPLDADSVDVIISNCVINLAADKSAVLREAFRVLKPGGRFAVSDVVIEGELPDAIRRDMEAFVGCVAGALEVSDYLARLRAAGFENISIEPTRRYGFADLEGSSGEALQTEHRTSCCNSSIQDLSPEERAGLDGRVLSAFIRASKPAIGPAPETISGPLR